MLRLTSVTSRLGGRTILDEVTLHAETAELLIVEAGRAAGKSTILRIAAALLRPDAGEVWIGDRDIVRLQRSSLPFVRRNVGYLPAPAPLIPGDTALESLMPALGLRGHTVAAARVRGMAALARLGLDGCAVRLVDTLSAGERRLLALARALAGEPPLLVIDDPSAGLAPADVGVALSALIGAAEGGAAVLCASADGAFVTAAVRAGGRRVRLDGGRVLGGARPRVVELVADPAPASERRPPARSETDLAVDEPVDEPGKR